MRRIALTALLLALFYAANCNTGTDLSPLDPARTDVSVELDATITEIGNDSVDGLLQLDFWIAPPRYFKVEWSGRNAETRIVLQGSRRFPDIDKTTTLYDTVRVREYVAFNAVEPFSLISRIQSYRRIATDTFVWKDCPLPEPTKFRGMCHAQYIYADRVR